MDGAEGITLPRLRINCFCCLEGAVLRPVPAITASCSEAARNRSISAANKLSSFLLCASVSRGGVESDEDGEVDSGATGGSEGLSDVAKLLVLIVERSLVVASRLGQKRIDFDSVEVEVR